VGFKRE